MATRVVQREPTWCKDKVLSLLSQRGYCIEVLDTSGKRIRARYTNISKERMAYQPIAEVELRPLDPAATVVRLTFPMKWRLVTSWVLVYTAITFLPITSIFLLLLYHSNVVGNVFPEHPRYSAAVFIVCIIWFLFVYFAGYRRVLLPERHSHKLEEDIWATLDPDGSLSHVVAALSAHQIRFWLTSARLCLLFACAGSVVFGVSIFLAPSKVYYDKAMDLVWGNRAHTLKYWYVSFLGSMSDIGRPLGLVGLGFGSALFVFLGCFVYGSILPHRYNWKAVLSIHYLNWAICVGTPSLLWLLYHASHFPLDRDQVGTFKCILLLCVVFCQLSSLPRTGHMHLKALKRPTTLYEPEWPKREGWDFRRLVRRFRLHVTLTLIIITIVGYSSMVYIAITLFSSVDAIFGRGSSCDSATWPVILSAEDTHYAAIESVFWILLMSSPLVLTLYRAARNRIAMVRTVRLAKQVAASERVQNLSDEILSVLSKRLGGDLTVAILPSPLLGVWLLRTSIFRQKYLLSVSIGAVDVFSEAEMESLLWHEYGHTSLIRRGFWRELTGLLVPWAPRMLDLREDLYEHERRSDVFAAEKMGSSEHLISALEKICAQRKSLGSRAVMPKDPLDVILGLGWSGYVHPDVEQRILWLRNNPESETSTVAAPSLVSSERPKGR
jgi:Zn-dependent protease with chaperone function